MRTNPTVSAVPARLPSSALPVSADAVNQALHLLAPTMTARIIQQLRGGPAGQPALLARMPEGSTSTLSYRLRTMRESGLIEGDGGERPAWQLTAAGQAALPVLRAVDEWARHRATPTQELNAVVGVEKALKVLSKANTTHVIIGLANGPLQVKELLAKLPAGSRENNLRDRLHFLASEQVIALDTSDKLMRYHLTLDGRRTPKIHHRAAAFAPWHADATTAAARSDATVPALVFSRPEQHRRAAA